MQKQVLPHPDVSPRHATRHKRQETRDFLVDTICSFADRTGCLSRENSKLDISEAENNNLFSAHIDELDLAVNLENENQWQEKYAIHTPASLNAAQLTAKAALTWANEEDAFYGKVKVVMMRSATTVATYHLDQEYGESVTYMLHEEEDGIYFLKKFRGGDWFSIQIKTDDCQHDVVKISRLMFQIKGQTEIEETLKNGNIDEFKLVGQQQDCKFTFDAEYKKLIDIDIPVSTLILKKLELKITYNTSPQPTDFDEATFPDFKLFRHKSTACARPRVQNRLAFNVRQKNTQAYENELFNTNTKDEEEKGCVNLVLMKKGLRESEYQDVHRLPEVKVGYKETSFILRDKDFMLSNYRPGDSYRIYGKVDGAQEIYLNASQIRFEVKTLRCTASQEKGEQKSHFKVKTDELLCDNILQQLFDIYENDKTIPSNQYATQFSLGKAEISRRYNVNIQDFFCAYGFSDVIHIDKSRKKLVKGNYFAAKLHSLEVRGVETDLPQAESVSFFKASEKHKLFPSVLLIGYLNGSVEVREAESLQIVCKTKPIPTEQICDVVYYYDLQKNIFLGAIMSAEQITVKNIKLRASFLQLDAGGNTKRLVQTIFTKNENDIFEFACEKQIQIHTEAVCLWSHRFAFQKSWNAIWVLNLKKICVQHDFKEQYIEEVHKTDFDVIKLVKPSFDPLFAIGTKQVQMLCDTERVSIPIKLAEKSNEIMDAVYFRGTTHLVITTKNQRISSYDLEDKSIKEMKKGIDQQWECSYSVQHSELSQNLWFSPCGRFLCSTSLKSLIIMHPTTFHVWATFPGVFGSLVGSCEVVFAKEINKGWCCLDILNSSITKTVRDTQLVDHTMQPHFLTQNAGGDHKIICDFYEEKGENLVTCVLIEQDGKLCRRTVTNLLSGRSFEMMDGEEDDIGWLVTPESVHLYRFYLYWVICNPVTNQCCVRRKNIHQKTERESIFLRNFTCDVNWTDTLGLVVKNENCLLLYNSQKYQEIDFSQHRIRNLGLDKNEITIYNGCKAFRIFDAVEKESVGIIYGDLQLGPTFLTDHVKEINKDKEINSQYMRHNSRVRVALGGGSLGTMLARQSLNKDSFKQLFGLKSDNISNETRVSPDAKTIIKEVKGSFYMQTMESEKLGPKIILKNMDGFKQLRFIENTHLAVKIKGKQGYSIYRVSDGSFFCQFDDRQFKLLRSTTQRELLSPLATGILDEQTKKIYPANVQCLLHLGAKSLHLYSQDLINSKTQKSDKILVLGLPAPGLFALSLYLYGQAGHAKEHLVTQQNLNYALWWEDDEYVVESIWNWMCLKNSNQPLKKYLATERIDNLNYLACNGSPIQVMQSKSAERLLDMLQVLYDKKDFRIISRLTLDDMTQMFDQPKYLCKQFFDLFTEENDTAFVYVQTAQLKTPKWMNFFNIIAGQTYFGSDIKPFSQIQWVTQIEDDQETKQRVIGEHFFSYKGGSPVKFVKVLTRFSFIPGSYESINFLKKLSQNEPQSDLFSSEVIKSILDYKRSKVLWVGWSFTLMQTTYLASILISQNKKLLIFWFLQLSSVELFQLCSGVEGISDVWDYFLNEWNICTLIQLYLMMDIVWRRPEVGDVEAEGYQNQIMDGQNFGYLICFANVGILQHLRLFKSLRSFILLFVTCLYDMMWFFVVLFVMIMAFTNAYYYKNLMEGLVPFEWKPEHTWYHYFKLQIRMLFGDFAVNNYDETEWNYFYICSLMSTLLMMNLLIAIISDTYERMMNEKEKSDYFQLCLLVEELERFIICNRNKIEKKGTLVYSEYMQDGNRDQWQGRVKEITQQVTKTLSGFETALHKNLAEQAQQLAQMRETQANDALKLKEELKAEFRSELAKLHDRLNSSSHSNDDD